MNIRYILANLLLIISFSIHPHNPCTQFPRINLGTFPTPICKLNNLGSELGIDQLYMKCDNKCGITTTSGQYFGGNKIRKLEFLLADALKQNKHSVITIGCAGSNHVVATGSSCAQCDLKCHAIIRNQPNSPVAQRNLKLMCHYNIALHPVTSSEERNHLYSTFTDPTTNEKPYQIPVGGSCPIGVLGFVNAAFELKEQIENRLLPEPDYIFVPVGSCGTSAGLLLGLKLAQLKSKVISVAIEPDTTHFYTSRIKELYTQTAQLLQITDLPILSDDDICIEYAHTGLEYGQWTDEAYQAIELLKYHEKIILDGTYSAKAFAALLDYANNRFLDNKTVLFWNTFCAEDFTSITDTIDYHKLPDALQQYFDATV